MEDYTERVLRRRRDLSLLLRSTMHQCVFVFIFTCFSPAPVGLFSRLGCGARRGAVCTRRVWVPGRLRGACSGSSKSQNLASNHGVAFRGARAEQDNEKPTCQPFWSTAVKGSNTVTTIASSFPRSYKYGHSNPSCDHDVCVCTGLSMCDAC